MRNLKKVLVMVLALAMMLSIMVVGAGAVPTALTDFDKIDDAHKEAVEMATQLNIINGYPDGSFQPQGPVTRAEISKMICIAINGGEVPATSVKAEPSYNDIQGTWAEGFIEYCTAKNIINGYPDGSFKPNANVTGAEAAKMMLTALGYNPEVEKYVGDGWDLYVNVQANQDGLYVNLLDVDKLTTEPLSREHTAQMVWNMLQAFTIRKGSAIDRSDGSITDTYSKSDTTLFWESYRGIYKDDVILQGFKHTSPTAKWTYYLADGTSVKSTNDYTEWLGHSVNVAYNADGSNATFKANNGTAYGIFHNEGANLVQAKFGDLGKIQPGDNTIEIDGKSYRMDKGTVADVPVYEFENEVQDYSLNPYVPFDYDKQQVNKTVVIKKLDGTFDVTTTVTTEDVTGGRTLSVLAGQIPGTNRWQTQWDHQVFTAVDQDEDGQIDFLLVVPYDVAQVTNVNGSKVTLNVLVPGGNFTAQKEFLEDVTSYDGIQRDDWVIYTHDVNTVDKTATIAKADLISGEITKANDRTPNDTAQCTIDGVQYTFSNYFDTTMGLTSELCRVGNRLDDAVVVNNYIFSVDFVKKAAITDYALMTAADSSKKDGDWAKLLFWDSKSAVTVSTDRNYNWIPEGTMVIYSRNADGDYKLNPIDDTLDIQRLDYVLEGYVTGAEKKSNSSDYVGFLDGLFYDKDAKVWNTWPSMATINDDAVIFVRYDKDGNSATTGDYGYKVLSGSQLKLNEAQYIRSQSEIDAFNTDADPLTTGVQTLILGSNYKNVNHVELAYVDVAPKLEDTNTLYAYVLDGANGMETSETRGDTVRGIDLWTAEGFQHLQFAGNIIARDAKGVDISADTKYKAIEPGMALKYKVNDDGDISEIVGFYDIDASWYDVNGSTTAATVAISSLNPLAFDGSTGEGKYWDISEATILYVDNTRQEGASYDVRDLVTADKNASGGLVDNAFVIYNNTNGTVALIIIDSENNIKEGR